MRRRLLTVIAIVLFLVGGAYGIVSWRLADTVTQAARQPVETTPADAGLAYRDVTFSPRDDPAIKLRGWLIPADDARGAIILVHGIDSAKDPSSLTFSRELVTEGFTVLVFDLQAHGESDGSRLTRGFFSGQDVLGAFDFLVEHEGMDSDRIGIRGVSIGAALTLMAAEQEPRVRALVVDSPFARLSDMVVNETRRRTWIPDSVVPVFVPGMVFMGRLLYDVDMYRVSPERATGNLDYPILLIHGDQDLRIPPEQSRRILAASRHPETRLWLVPGADHTEGYKLFPEEYVSQVVGYFERQFTEPVQAQVPGRQVGTGTSSE